MRRLLLPAVLLLLGLAGWALLRATTGPQDGAAIRVGPDAASEPDAAALRGRTAATGGAGVDESADTDLPARPPPAESWEFEGRVVDAATKEGIPDALVHVELVRGGVRGAMGEVTAREDGTFHLPLPHLDDLSPAQLAVARLVVYARADGYWQDNHRRDPAFVRLARALADRRASATLRLRQGPRMHGRVLDTDGRPVAGAWVSRSWRLSATRGLGGGTACCADYAGEYWLPVSTPRQFEAMQLSAKRTWAAVQGTSLLLSFDRDRPLDRLPDLILERPGTGTIAGRVVFPDGTPGSDVDLTCRIRSPDAGRAHVRTRTDAEGVFELANLPAGVGTVKVVVPRSPSRLSGPPDLGHLDVTTGDRDVVLVLPRPRVRLRVVDPEGNPVPGARWFARLRGEGKARTQGDTIAHPDGVASAWGLPGDRVALVVRTLSLRSTEAVVDLPAGTWTRDAVLVVEPWQDVRFGTLRVEATRPNGEELASVRLCLRSPAADCLLDLVGHVTHTRGDSPLQVPSGRWRLVLKPATKPRDWLEERHEIEIEPGQELRVVTTVEEGGLLQVDVEEYRTIVRGRPVRVRLVPDDEARDTVYDTLSRAVRWRLAAGGWSMHIEAEGCRSVTERIVVETGRVTVVDVVLVPE